MFLAECYGMSPRPELREKLAKAVKLIVNCQNKDGGWRYQPHRADADISVTVCQVMALRAARNAGLFVPTRDDRPVDRLRQAEPERRRRLHVHDPRRRKRVSALGRRRGGRSLQRGIYEGPEITKGLDYLMQFIPAEGDIRRENYYFYGQYYAVQAMWQAGGERWSRWYPAIRDELVARQHDGSWMSPAEGNECATAMACIVLQMPNNYLPIFQR